MLIELNEDELSLINSALAQYDIFITGLQTASTEADEVKRLDALFDAAMDLRRKLWKIRRTAKATLV
jgi:hypothetical protein